MKVHILAESIQRLAELRGLVTSGGWRPVEARLPLSVHDLAAGDGAGCILVDLGRCTPRRLENLEQLCATCRLPVVVVVTEPTVPLAVRIMKAGAADFVAAAGETAALLRALRGALENSVRIQREKTLQRELARRLRTLTPREEEVLDLVAAGLTSIEIARRLGLSRKTVEVHRANMLRKMRARGVVDLVRAALTVDRDDCGPR